MPMRAIIFDCIPEECKHCKYVQLCKGGVYDRRYIWNKTLSKKDPYCIYTPGGEDFNKIEITDAKFNSVHHGYLPTMFFGLYNVKELCEKYDANIVCRNKLDDSENWVEFTLEIAKADK